MCLAGAHLCNFVVCVCPLLVMYVCMRVCIGRGPLLLFSPHPPSLNTPGSRASTASAAAVLSSSSHSRHHKSLSSSNHPCPSDLHAPRSRQVSRTLTAPSDLFSSYHRSSVFQQEPDGQKERWCDLLALKPSTTTDQWPDFFFFFYFLIPFYSHSNTFWHTTQTWLPIVSPQNGEIDQRGGFSSPKREFFFIELKLCLPAVLSNTFKWAKISCLSNFSNLCRIYTLFIAFLYIILNCFIKYTEIITHSIWV